MKDRLARLPATSGEDGFPDGPRGGLCEATGHWANCDVWINAPANWEDVDLVLAGQSGNIEVIFDHRQVSDMQSPLPSAGGAWNGIILSARGRRCDRYVVYGYNTTIDHDFATFHMELWGEDGAGYGDRATRAVVDPYGRPNQTRRFPSPVPFPVGALTTIAPANPSGQRVGLTSLEWTNDASAVPPPVWPLLTITSLPSGTVLGVYSMGIAANVIAMPFTPPIWTAPGESIAGTITGGPGGLNYINASYIYA